MTPSPSRERTEERNDFFSSAGMSTHWTVFHPKSVTPLSGCRRVLTGWDPPGGACPMQARFQEGGIFHGGIDTAVYWACGVGCTWAGGGRVGCGKLLAYPFYELGLP